MSLLVLVRESRCSLNVITQVGAALRRAEAVAFRCVEEDGRESHPAAIAELDKSDALESDVTD